MRKNLLALLLSCVLLLALVPAAYAYESPTDASIVVEDSAVTVTVERLDAATTTQMQTAADPAIADILAGNAASVFTADEQQIADFMARIPENATAETLMSMNLSLAGATFPLEVTINVSDVKANDAVFVAHQKEDGTVEYLIPKTTADGRIVVEFTSLSPVMIVKLAAPGQEAASLPKTGDTAPIAYALAALVASAAAAVVLAKRIRKA